MTSQTAIPDAHRPEGAAAPVPTDAPIFSRFIDDEIYLPLLVEFAVDLPGHIDEIADAVGRHDYKETSRLSHRLKGAAATYGYPELSQLAGEAEVLTTPETGGVLVVDDRRLGELAEAMRSVGRRICLGTKLRNPSAPLQ